MELHQDDFSPKSEAPEETYKASTDRSRNSHTLKQSNNKIANNGPFLITTTDLIARLNRAMVDFSPVASSEAEPAEATAINAPKFELQLRLPDGSTRRATVQEEKAADLESKLQQALLLTADLSPEQTWTWLQETKAVANDLYVQKLYEKAIDVYLSCVMVAQNLYAVQKQKRKQPLSPQGDNSVMNSEHDHVLLFLQLMNNLSQAALKMSWYYKAIQFGNLAVERLQQSDDNDLNVDLGITQQWIKLYFKRARAHRLRGEYKQAQQDLDKAGENMVIIMTTTAPMPMEEEDRDDLAKMQLELNRERTLIQRAIVEERKSQQRQQKAMQQLFLGVGAAGSQKQNVDVDQDRTHDHKHQQTASLSCTSATANTTTTARTYSALGKHRKNSKNNNKPLYPPNDDSNYSSEGHRRAFSSLRAPKPKWEEEQNFSDLEDDDDDRSEDKQIDSWLKRYWHYYLVVVGRIAEELFVWMGDDDIVQKRIHKKEQLLEQARLRASATSHQQCKLD